LITIYVTRGFQKTMNNPLLGNLSPEQFLKQHWQKQALLVRSALPDFSDPLSPEELAGLACEQEVESRLVLEQNGAWNLRHGPFNDEDFPSLPETHWTLLVQDMEKHLPELSKLLEPFRFIPDWRIDDLMIGYATAQGSAGPHRDNYDVFLLQGKGRRRWQIGNADDALLPDTELRILANFFPTEEWILEPGDLLYLPPHVPHYGVALEPCMTYSIGFRAPSHQDLVSSFMDFLLDQIDSDIRYQDPELSLQDNPGKLTDTALDQIKTILKRYLHTEDQQVERWFGRYITEPKPQFAAEAASLSLADLKIHAHNGGNLEHNPGSRFAYRQHATTRYLYVDGQEFMLTSDTAFLAPLLCRHRVLTPALLEPALRHPQALALLQELLEQGCLVIYEY